MSFLSVLNIFNTYSTRLHSGGGLALAEQRAHLVREPHELVLELVGRALGEAQRAVGYLLAHPGLDALALELLAREFGEEEPHLGLEPDELALELQDTHTHTRTIACRTYSRISSRISRMFAGREDDGEPLLAHQNVLYIKVPDESHVAG